MDKTQFEKYAVTVRERAIEVASQYVKGEIVEDVAQDTLLKLWVVHERLTDKSMMMAFATVISRNASIDQLRKQRLYDDIDSMQDMENNIVSDCVDGHIVMEELENEKWLMFAKKQLPDRLRIVLRMSQNEGLSNEDIAGLLGISEVSVRGMLSKARRRLLELLNRRNKR